MERFEFLGRLCARAPRTDNATHWRRVVTSEGGMSAITMPAARGTIAIVASSMDEAIAVEKSLRTI